MRSSRSPLKNLVARGLLALAFLFAQQTAALHWLSHAIEATHAKAGAGSAPADHCDECLTLGALGAAATGSTDTPPIAAGQHALLALPDAVPSPAALRLAFQSRAPPILS
jgi:hypothetical protein